MMKNTIIIMSAALLLNACYNKPFDYDDFDYQTVCFPYQYPVRTLSLGNDVLDNSLDRAHRFNIGVVLGGVYIHNDHTRTVYYEVDESLVRDDLYNINDEKIRVMPTSYYSLSNDGRVDIPKGQLNGLITVQLNDEYFNDPDSYKGVYVIPMRIVKAEKVDSVLRGRPAVKDPDIHNAAHWEVTPKDYTLFGVKYVNPYHGKWLRRGITTVKYPTGEEVERIIYHAQDLELNEIVELSTISMSEVVGKWRISDDDISVHMIVKDDIISVDSPEGSIAISGSGKYVENDAEWGGTLDNPRKRDVLYLQYEFNRTDGNKCEVRDTLVFRDRGLVFEDERPVIK